jgi:hypothetical protein
MKANGVKVGMKIMFETDNNGPVHIGTITNVTPPNNYYVEVAWNSGEITLIAPCYIEKES